MTDARLQGPAVRDFAGCAILAQSQATLLADLARRLDAGERRLLVGHHNLHSLYLRHRDPGVAEYYRRCTTCYVDGVPVLWLLRAAGLDMRDATRFSFMDSLPELLELARERGLRIFYLGADPEAVRQARDWVARDWPQLAIGWQHGYFSDSQPVIEAINDFRPDLLLVGMGMPRQEHWVLAHLSRLDVGAVLQTGGTLDYYTGRQAKPPAGWSPLGLGWLYRLLHDPRRLWRRYLLTPWALIAPWLRLRLALRRSSAAEHP